MARSTPAASLRTPRDTRWPFIGLYLGLLLLTLVLYSGYCDNYLYNDDALWLSKARYDMDLSNVFTIRVIGFFRPLINLSFFISERIAPGDLRFYYYSNIVLHWINSILVFHLIGAFTRDRSLAAMTALLFAATSCHSAAVAWISARTTLIAFQFLALSLLALSSGLRHRLKIATLLYAAALLSKETAVVGLLLVALLGLAHRNRSDSAFGKQTTLFFGLTSAAYLLLRAAAMGDPQQSAWGIGWHAIRNVGGGFLYNLYPWSLLAFFGLDPAAAEPSSALWPEILAIPVIAGLLYLARRMHRFPEMAVAIAWILIALVPSALFKYRFFSQASMTHDRYYYLSSVGACLVVSLLLRFLWTHTMPRKIAVVALLCFMIAGEGRYIRYVDTKFGAYTNQLERTVEAIGWRMDRTNGVRTCVIETPPMNFHYVRGATRLAKPDWQIVQVGSAAEAQTYQPCLYLQFYVSNGRPTLNSTLLRE